MTVRQHEHTSPTRRALDGAVLARLAAKALPGAQVAGWEALGGGEFAAVAKVTLEDGRELVLKLGPAPAARLLAYERGMIAAEVRYLRRLNRDLPDAPVAKVLAHGADDGVVEGEWMLVTLLPGRTLSTCRQEAAEAGETQDPGAAVREQLGAVCARVHTLEAPAGRFGYDDAARPGGADWPQAFTAMTEALLADAQAWDLALPAPPERVRAAVRRHHDALAQVRRARLVHFDLWDGNVLAAPGPDGVLRLTGLVDGERFLHGDPLIDFVSPALGRRIELEPAHPFLAGYRAASGGQARFTQGELRRLALYRLYLYLLMYVEMPSRGKADRAEHAERWEVLTDRLLDELSHVEAL